MDMNLDTIEVNGKKYVSADSVQSQPAVDVSGKTYCIVRTYNAGVFAGYVDIDECKSGSATVRSARRLWYWDGAASLSQLAVDGTSKPSKCKFPCEVDSIILNNIIEAIPATSKAKDSLCGVKIWEQ